MTTLAPQVVLVYYTTAALIHYVIPALISVKRLQPTKTQSPSDVRRDMIRSFLPLVIKGLSLFIAETLHNGGYGVMNDSAFLASLLDPRQLPRIAGLWFARDLFHDTWFYFAHRCLHQRWVLRNVHYMHHQSTTPSAFTGYSFHWCGPREEIRLKQAYFPSWPIAYNHPALFVCAHKASPCAWMHAIMLAGAACNNG